VACEPAEHGIDREALVARVGAALHEDIGLTMSVELMAPGAVPRSEGKAVRVVDRR
jgi:phenylacetate-CoA ligase